MIEISSVRNPSRCEHCGTPITNVYVIRELETGFLIRVGSTCVRSVIAVTQKGQDYLQKEVTKAHKHLAHKERIKKALESGEQEKLIKAFGKIHWQQNPERSLEETAEVWLEILQNRFDSRMKQLSEMYKHIKIRPVLK